jgi:Peptidase family M1 domain
MRYLFLLTFCFTIASLSAQQSLPTPKNIQQAYTKGTRSLDGKPGKNYWQNKASYTLVTNFDPATRLVSGSVDIDYINNSPDTLRQIHFKLYPNLYKKGAPRQAAISPEDLSDGVVIDQMNINGQISDISKLRTDNTNMWARIAPLIHGNSIHFTLRYHYTLNKGSHTRTGEIEQGAAFIAYFFPRIAVYDDIDGWNTYPYNGTQEFYNDFCHFNAAITVPKGYIVWATGDLKNAEQVLQPVYLSRLQQSALNDSVTNIISPADLEQGNITPAENATNTWQFEADNVTDFAFAISDHYCWQASSLVVDPQSKRRTRVDAAFNPEHKDYYDVIGDARKTVQAMSYIFPAWPFPYSHETVFDGLDQMEYPMMVNDNPVSNRTDGITLTDHEIFHTMFPFYMGINETKYAWMDEGWATIGEWLISPMIDSSIVDEYGVAPYSFTAGSETDLPIKTLSTELNRGYFTNSYPKPAMGYLYVKDMLGDALFTKALHHYIEQWQGKHPMPNDFFYSMNEGAGRNMNWFWKKWFFDDGVPDLSIATVKKVPGKYIVTIASKGTKPVPIDLVILYTDNTSQVIHRSIAAWEKAPATVAIDLATSKTVKTITLGGPHTPDSNVKDNLYISQFGN